MPKPDETVRCWRCQKIVPWKVSRLCDDCHPKEVTKVHAHDTPDVPEVAVLGKYVVPYERRVRPHSSGRRVVRKSEPMAG